MSVYEFSTKDHTSLKITKAALEITISTEYHKDENLNFNYNSLNLVEILENQY